MSIRGARRRGPSIRDRDRLRDRAADGAYRGGRRVSGRQRLDRFSILPVIQIPQDGPGNMADPEASPLPVASWSWSGLRHSGGREVRSEATCAGRGIRRRNDAVVLRLSVADDLSHRTWALRGWYLDRLALCALQQDRGSELAGEDPDITLVIIYRLRSLARRPLVPQRHYGEVRPAACSTRLPPMTCTSR